MGVASLVLGILAVLIGIFSSGVLGWLGAIMAIIGVVMGALGMKKPESKGIATAGLVLSIVGGIMPYHVCSMRSMCRRFSSIV